MAVGKAGMEVDAHGRRSGFENGYGVLTTGLRLGFSVAGRGHNRGQLVYSSHFVILMKMAM